MQHSAEEILASIPLLVQEAVTASEEVMQDAETLAERSRDLLEQEMRTSWDSELIKRDPLRLLADTSAIQP